MFPLFFPSYDLPHLSLKYRLLQGKKRKGWLFFFKNISRAIKVIIMIFSCADILLVSFTAETKWQVQLGTIGKGC